MRRTKAPVSVVRKIRCGRCEDGWIEGPGGWSPCLRCNADAVGVITAPPVDVPQGELGKELQGALDLMEAGKVSDPGIKDKIRDSLLELTHDDKKRLYKATRDLAIELFGTETRDWNLERWEQFTAQHTDPIGDLKELSANTTQDEANATVTVGNDRDEVSEAEGSGGEGD